MLCVNTTLRLILSASLLLTSVFNIRAEELRHVPTQEAMKAVVFVAKPQYDDIARQLKLVGSVNLDAVVGEDGAVEAVTVVKGNPVLGRLATDAVKKWRFTPFKTDGKTAKVVAEIVLQFSGDRSF
jgi:TonB family protein